MTLQNINPPMQQLFIETDSAALLFWRNFRAALLKEAHDLQELRASKLQLAASIKLMLDKNEKTETQKIEA